MEQEDRLCFWVEANELFEKSCREMDQVWQKRKRVLDTKWLVIFILKMVLSKNKQGYGSNLNHLWEACAEKGITPPQLNSVAPSSLCEARQKLPETVFKILNQELISLWHRHREMPLWKGHQVFAIDGSKINAPRGLLNYGYKTAKDTSRHYPYGTMSCLYNLQEQIVYDFELVSHGDERSCAIEHLKHLCSGDLVIFDRGYFSYLMLYQIVELKLHAVFRLQSGAANSQVAAFWKSDKDDELIDYYPSQSVKYDLKKRGHTLDFKAFAIRLIKHKIGDETYVYATTLVDSSRYPADCFPDLYHGRWGIEELYKISKHFIDVEDFHSQTERGVKHEIYGHFLLTNIARLFETDARKGSISDRKVDDPQRIDDKNAACITNPDNPFKINFKNCVAVVGRHLENLMLGPKQLISSWLHKAMLNVSKIKQRIRPNRSYPRVSFKPRTKWNPLRSSLKTS